MPSSRDIIRVKGTLEVPFTRYVAVAAALAVSSLGLLCVPAQAQILRQLTDLNRDYFIGWHVDDPGRTVVAVWSGDPLGTNPDHVHQIFKWELPGGAITQLTSFPGGLTRNVSISDNGEWIVFDSRADPVQQNGDGTLELFLMRSDGTDITQLTNDDTLGSGRPECPAISGSGNRVLFYGTYDPNGTNPDHLTQLFVLDLASSNLTQLTQGDSGIHLPDSYPNGRCHSVISDDGERIAFTSHADLTGTNPEGGPEVFGINADGQGLTQLTLTDGADAWGISGNGERIVFWDAWHEVCVVNWDGSGYDCLNRGFHPTITDDGTRVYYHEDTAYNYHIFVIDVESHNKAQLTQGSVDSRNPVISRAGNRIVFISQYGEYPGGSNPDHGPELMAMNGNGQDVQQLTVNEPCASPFAADITASGARVAYCSEDTGRFLYGLHYVDVDGSGPVTVFTDDRVHAFESSTITADGETIVFMSWYDLTGNGLCGTTRDVFRVQADGTGLAQLTFDETCQHSASPVAAANGSVVVFQSNGFGTETGTGVFAIPLEGGDVTLIAEDESGWWIYPTISADGMWAAWDQQVPPDGFDQVFRGRTDGSVVEMLTDDPDDSSDWPDISGDGQLVVYDSRADPLGTNPDRNSEIFLYDAATRSLQQLTVTSEGGSAWPRISDDGEWVYLNSSSPFHGPVIAGTSSPVYRLSVATGAIERAGGLSRGSASNVDADGGRAVIQSSSAPTGDPSPWIYDLWLTDFDTPATIRPSAAAPTVVEWDPDPRALHYDVIRGDVASLAAGASNTVDLGTVVCLENDTVNTNTAGAEADADQPGPGQVFFFLRRWSQGIGDTPSYGQGSGEAERVASGGDCQQ